MTEDRTRSRAMKSLSEAGHFRARPPEERIRPAASNPRSWRLLLGVVTVVMLVHLSRSADRLERSQAGVRQALERMEATIHRQAGAGVQKAPATACAMASAGDGW